MSASSANVTTPSCRESTSAHAGDGEHGERAACRPGSPATRQATTATAATAAAPKISMPLVDTDAVANTAIGVDPERQPDRGAAPEPARQLPDGQIEQHHGHQHSDEPRQVEGPGRRIGRERSQTHRDVAEHRVRPHRSRALDESRRRRWPHCRQARSRLSGWKAGRVAVRGEVRRDRDRARDRGVAHEHRLSPNEPVNGTPMSRPRGGDRLHQVVRLVRRGAGRVAEHPRHTEQRYRHHPQRAQRAARGYGAGRLT